MLKNLQIRKILKLPSSRKEQASPTQHLREVSREAPVKLLSRCHEVTMDKFIACLCDNDLGRLIESGEPSPVQLAEAWASLFYEYCDLAEATETKYRIKISCEIKLLKIKEELAQGWLDILNVCYIPQLASALKLIGYEDYELNPADIEQYYEDLKHITGELNLLRMQTKIKEIESKAILESQPTHDSVDRKYFNTIFFRINNYAKREAVNGQTTVEDYCTALRDYVSYYELQKKSLK